MNSILSLKQSTCFFLKIMKEPDDFGCGVSQKNGLWGLNEFRHPAIFHEKQAPCETYPGLRQIAGCTTSGGPILNWWPGPQFDHLELSPAFWVPSLVDFDR